MKFTTALQLPAIAGTIIFDGSWINGNSLSITVTSNEQVEIFPDKSVAVVMTLVVPIGKNEPEACELRIIAELLSVAVTLKFTTAPHIP